MRSPIEARIAALQELQQEFHEFRRKIDAFPAAYRDDIAAELRSMADALAPAENEATKPTELFQGDEDEDEDEDELGTGTGPTVVERMQDYFQANHNRPATVQTIAAATGATLDSVRAILYKRNRGRFVKTGTIDNANLWRMADQVKNENSPRQGVTEDDYREPG